jgi:hypothetical protein
MCGRVWRVVRGGEEEDGAVGMRGEECGKECVCVCVGGECKGVRGVWGGGGWEVDDG